MKPFLSIRAALLACLMALPAAADGLRLRLELWEVSATELAQRMDAEGSGETWLLAFRKDALTGKLPGVKLLTSAALAVPEAGSASQNSSAEEIYPVEYEAPGLGGFQEANPAARLASRFAIPDAFETRNTGQDLALKMHPVAGGTRWEIVLAGGTSLLHGMRQWGDPALQISLPVFDLLRLDHIVTLPLSQWRTLSLGPSSSALPPGQARPGPVGNPQDIAASRQIRRLMLVRLEPNE